MSNLSDAKRAEKAWAEKLARLKSRKPLERTVTFHDEAATEARDEARDRLDRTRKRVEGRIKLEADVDDDLSDLAARVEADPDVTEAREVYDAAEAERVESEIHVDLRGLGSHVWEALLGEHPPTDEQAKLGQQYNVETFPAAAVAACCVDPMSEEDAADLLRALPAGEAQLLFTTAVGVNQSSRASLGKGSRATRN